MNKLLSIIFLAAALAACAPQVEKTEVKDAQALVDSFLYVKAKNGLCFGITTTSRISSNIIVAENNHVVLVPTNYCN